MKNLLNKLLSIYKKIKLFLVNSRKSQFRYTKREVNHFISLEKQFKNENTQPDTLINEKIAFYKNRYAQSELRILIQVPPIEFSPGGFSIFSNIIENLNHMGVQTKALNFDDEVEVLLQSFNPNILLSSDHSSYLERINWSVVNEYKKERNLKVGLTAALECYGNPPLSPRLDWARANQIDFFYNFRAKKYTDSRKEYNKFREFEYSIINMEFGVNILKFFPKYSKEKPYDYLFFGSVNPEKGQRYLNYFSAIQKNYKGMIYGPGWSWADRVIPLNLQNNYYSLSKVGLNLHLPEQIEWPCELNERTYILGICKIPQLIDQPALLLDRYSDKSMFIGATPSDYHEAFRYILANPEIAKEKAEHAYIETLDKHTSFHRLESFIKQLENL
jgi:hypothetical protein